MNYRCYRDAAGTWHYPPSMPAEVRALAQRVHDWESGPRGRRGYTSPADAELRLVPAAAFRSTEFQVSDPDLVARDNRIRRNKYRMTNAQRIERLSKLQ